MLLVQFRMWGGWEREFGESVEDWLALEPWHTIEGCDKLCW